MMYKAKPTSVFIRGRLYNYHVCVSILIHFVLHKIVTFRFAKALHFVLPDLLFYSVLGGLIENGKKEFVLAMYSRKEMMQINISIKMRE